MYCTVSTMLYNNRYLIKLGVEFQNILFPKLTKSDSLSILMEKTSIHRLTSSE